MATPYALVVLDQTSSTQDEARQRFDGTPLVVVAHRQTRGRGRSGSSWEAAPRAAAISLALALDWPTETWPRLSLVAGLAAHRVLGAATTLKWPNDVLVAGDKVAGLLVEATGAVVVAGLGVNLWWPDSPAGFAALYQDDPGEELMLEVAERWAAEMLAMVSMGPDGWGIDDYRFACQTIGADITWQPDGAGHVIDVNDDGTLAVRTAGGVVALAAGEVHEVRPGGPFEPFR